MYTHREKEGRREGRRKEKRKGKGRWAIKKWDNEFGPRLYGSSLYYSSNISVSLKLDQNLKLQKGGGRDTVQQTPSIDFFNEDHIQLKSS